MTPFSVHFRFPGSAAIVLRDVVQDVEIGQTPEWVAGIDSFPTSEGPDDLGPPPAAYVRGSTIAIEVTFLRTVDAQDGGAPAMSLTIGATGSVAGVTEQNVTLTFDADGRSNAQRFTLDRVIANDVGQVTLSLDWYVTASGVRQEIAPVPCAAVHVEADDAEHARTVAGVGGRRLVYVDIVRFAAGRQSRSVRVRCHFQEPGKDRTNDGVPGWSPRQMILGQGGMCGGWDQLFQLMVHSQGVFIEKTAFLVNWRQLPIVSAGRFDIQWNAIVVSRRHQSADPHGHALGSFTISRPFRSHHQPI